MYYVGKDGGGVYRSTNGGTTWSEVFNNRICGNSSFNSLIETVPGEARNLFFTAGLQAHFTNEGFYRSTDGGGSWTAIPNVAEVSCFGFGKSATPSGYPSIYIAGYVNGVYGIWQSNDNAKSWAEIGQHPDNSLAAIKTISGDPNIYGQVYVGLAGAGFAYLPALPVMTSVAASVGTGSILDAGKTITLTALFSEAVTVVGGVPTLTLNNGGIGTYEGGSGTDALIFTYTVAAGQDRPQLLVTGLNPNSATATDASGNAVGLTGASLMGGVEIDTTAPTVTSVVDTPKNADLGAGNVVAVTLNFSEAVTVAGGVPTLTLNDGGEAIYTGGSGSNVLTFSYTVKPGENTPALEVDAVNLNSATIQDQAGNGAARMWLEL
jgi:hypothetical protein